MPLGRNPKATPDADVGAASSAGKNGARGGETQAETRSRVRAFGDRVDALGARGFERVAEALEHTGDVIEERSGEGRATRTVAEPLRRAGRYVGERSPASALADLDGAIERHPYRSLAVGIGMGWAIGRLTRRLRSS